MFSNGPRLLRPFRCRNSTRRRASLAPEARPFEDIPSPPALPILGTTLSLLASGGVTKLHVYVDKRHRQLGHIYKDRIGPVDAVFLSHPEDMRTVFAHEGKYPVHLLPDAWVVYNDTYGCSRGLFFMDGDEWLHFRRIMNGHLLRGNRIWIDHACAAVTDTLLERLARSEGVVNNLEQELYLWSMQVLVATLLGAEAYKESYANIRMMMQLLADKVHLIFKATSKLSLLPASLAAKWNIPAWKTFVSCVDNALKMSRSLVDVLLDRCPEGDGLLQRLKAEDGVTRSDLVRLVTDLILAAGDTTAYSMEWMLYCLARDPKVQEAVRGSSGEDREVVLRCVLKETLRLYPVAPFLTRILPEECVLSGYKVPARTLLILSIFTSGRDGRFFSEPEDFRPDRWMRTEPGSTTVSRGLMKHASLPFAMGARSCIGRRIAETQLQVTTGRIVDGFRIGLCNRREVDVALRMVAVPSEPLRLKFERL